MTIRVAASRGAVVRRLSFMLLLGTALGGIALPLASAHAQNMPSAPAVSGEQENMLVEADALYYDMKQNTMSAQGNVQVYYGAYRLFADRVDVDRKTNEVHATGNVELQDDTGAIARGTDVKLDQKLSAGVIKALEIASNDSVGLRAANATRVDQNTEVFDDATYLPCVDCNGRPGQEPLWHIRAKRVVHKSADHTIAVEDASFELMGVPIAWVPKLTLPDQTQKRQSGFLLPYAFYSKKLGYGVNQSYFWALKPDMDLTVTATPLSRQGVLLNNEWRQVLNNGSYKVMAAGVSQRNPQDFSGTSGDRKFRGTVETRGNFQITDRWGWGWSLALPTDRSFYSDYKLKTGADTTGGNLVEDLYLNGSKGRKSFSAHLYAFVSQTEDNTSSSAAPQTVGLQSKQPIVHPVVDYNVVKEEPVYDGELSYNVNLTSLSRAKTDLYQSGNVSRVQGLAGDFNRLSVDAMWRRRIVDPLGQVFTPFTYVQGDFFYTNAHGDSSGLSNGGLARVMPAVGMEYSYPWLINMPLGNQVFEPVAQVIFRPNEYGVNKVANEDSQSLVFDDSSLFDFNKFSGYDRVEGGSRANLGFRYTANMNDYGTYSALFGRSYALFGQNSYALSNIYGTGYDSGLQTAQSDWVARLALDTNRGVQYATRARFDTATFKVKRAEAEISGAEGPFTASLIYAYLAKQPDLGITDDRQEIMTSLNARLTDHWRLFGSSRYNIHSRNFLRYGVGVGFDEQSLSWSLTYSLDRTSSPTDQVVYLSVGLRTLGSTSTSANLSH